MAVNQGDSVLAAVALGELELFQSRLAAIDGASFLEKFEMFKDEYGWTALHYASLYGHHNICQFLIETVGVNINCKDNRGVTPLAVAIKKKHIHITNYLVKNGADVNEKIIGKQPIHYAASNGLMEIMQLLITNGAVVDGVIDDQTPLQYVASLGNKEAVGMSLNHNANPNSSSQHTITPLMLSMAAGSAECVELLLKAGADSDKHSLGVAPFVFAALRVENTHFIQLLLDAGANPNIRDMTGFTPLEHAIRAGNHDGAAILFPLTSRDPSVTDWSINGITRHIQSGEGKKQRELTMETAFLSFKEKGEEELERNDLWNAVLFYTQALFIKPSDAIVLSNRYSCWERLGKTKRAIRDAVECLMSPDEVEGHHNINKAKQLIRALGADLTVAGLKGTPEPPAYKAMRKAFE